MSEATLLVGTSSTECSACLGNVLPNAITHEVTGYRLDREGCGATFTAISSNYFWPDGYNIRKVLHDMRPDLPVVGVFGGEA